MKISDIRKPGRYDMGDYCSGEYPNCRPVKCSDGDFVYYDDYEVLLERLETAEKALEEIQKNHIPYHAESTGRGTARICETALKQIKGE